MFNIEDKCFPEEEEIPETNVTTRSQNPLKEDNLILPKIKKLQENMKKMKNNTPMVNIPEFVISGQSPKKVNVPTNPTKNKAENFKKSLTEHEMGYDVVEDIKRDKANISLFEMWNLPQQKENLLKALETPVKEPQNDNQPEEEIGEIALGGNSKYRTPTFLLTFEFFNYNVHNCLVDSGASVNVMALLVCKKIKNNTPMVNIPNFVISGQSPKKFNMPINPTENKAENVKKNLTEHEMGYDIVEDIKKAKENISLF